MKRLLSKKERRLHKDGLTEAQKKRCRRSAREILDCEVDRLNDLVRDIDTKVTKFRKEVDEERRTSTSKDSVAGIGNDDDDGGTFLADDGAVTDEDGVSGMNPPKERRAAPEKDWDNHPHASRKRKSSYSAAGPSSRKRSKQKRRRRGPGRTAGTTGGDPERDANAGGRARPSSETEFLPEAAEEQHSTESVGKVPGGSASFGSTEEADAEADPPSADVIFVGETDDFDDHLGGSVLPVGAGGSSGRAVSRTGAARQQPRSTATSSRTLSRGGSGSVQQASSMAETMAGWLEKQRASGTVGGESEATARRRQSGLSSFVRIQTNGNSGNRHASTTRDANSARASNRKAFGQASTRARRNGRMVGEGVQGACSLKRAIRANAQSNNSGQGRGGGDMPRSKHARARPADGEVAPARPSIPNALSAEMLFDTLSLRSEDGNAAAEREQPTYHGSDKSLDALCQMLKNSFPIDLRSCHESLTSLTASIISKSGEPSSKEDAVAVFQTLLTVFKRKCTTLLDILQTHPGVALFQLDCWSLVFCMLEKKWNNAISPEDKVLRTIFGKSTALAHHVLFQVLDALCSQLLWEEYGATPTFDARTFDGLRALCVQIGKVVPLLPTVCSLLLKMGSLKWHASLTNGEKENDPAKAYYVSAIDPLMHKRFISSGEALPNSECFDDSHSLFYSSCRDRCHSEAHFPMQH